MELKDTFDTVAAAYDAARHGYPEALFDDLVAIASLGQGSRVLELGCGSGQATIGFAARGCAVLGVEPGAELIRRARQRFAAVPNVAFTVGGFEAWPLEAQAFDLVAAAQSWHWIDPAIAFGKAAAALRPGGHLAIFGHTPLPSENYVTLAGPIYHRLAPELCGVLDEAWYLPSGPIAGLFAASGRFAAVQQRAYRWQSHYTPQSFIAYLSTHSRHTRLPADRRAALFTELESALTERGGDLTVDWATTLYVAQVLPIA
jgi:SAM-dependent methyltransferase